MGFIKWLKGGSPRNYSEHDIWCIQKSMETMGYSNLEIEDFPEKMQEEMVQCPYCKFRLEKYYAYGARNSDLNIMAILAQRKMWLQDHVRIVHGKNLP